MYPNMDFPGYGSFVKNVVDGLEKIGYAFPYKAVINGKAKSKFGKIKKYIGFYINIIRYYFKKYDFIYIHFPNHALPILLPLFFLKRKKVIINLHGEDLLYNDFGIAKYLGKMNDYFMTKVDAIVVPSEYFKRLVIDRMSLPENKLIVSPSAGIDPECFHPIEKENILNGEGSPLLGYVGRIDEGKGWEEFVDIMYTINSRGLNCNGLMIGTGTQKEKLLTKLTDLNIKNIRYIDHVGQSDLLKYYGQMSLLLLFSTRKAESLGLVGIEAMACGVPVMSGNKFGVSTYLNDKENGFFIENNDVNKAIDVIKDYIDMPLDGKNLMRNNCLTTAKKYFRNNVVNKLAEDIGKLAIVKC